MKSILFVCIENSCRSQIAEGFARARRFPAARGLRGNASSLACRSKRGGGDEGTGDRYLTPGSQLHRPQDRGKYDCVITMGCGADGICPAGFLGVSDDWEIPDPKGTGIEEFRSVRDLIRARVEELLRTMKEDR